ncbi:MAG: NAD-binding protein [Oscillospiraceae bacterium]
MKIIIAGDGKVGMTLTRQLSAEGHDLTLIDNDLSALESSEERYDIMVVHGNCALMPVLRQAGILEETCSLPPPGPMRSICFAACRRTR